MKTLYIGNLFFYFIFHFPNVKSVVYPIAIECILSYILRFFCTIFLGIQKKNMFNNTNTYYHYVLKDGL